MHIEFIPPPMGLLAHTVRQRLPWQPPTHGISYIAIYIIQYTCNYITSLIPPINIQTKHSIAVLLVYLFNSFSTTLIVYDLCHLFNIEKLLLST